MSSSFPQGPGWHSRIKCMMPFFFLLLLRAIPSVKNMSEQAANPSPAPLNDATQRLSRTRLVHDYRQINAVVDTGAESPVLSPNLAELRALTESLALARAARGNDAPVLVYTDATALRAGHVLIIPDGPESPRLLQIGQRAQLLPQPENEDDDEPPPLASDSESDSTCMNGSGESDSDCNSWEDI